jgi:hypothetical protein
VQSKLKNISDNVIFMPRKKNVDCDEKMMRTPGFAWRVSVSILAVFGLVVFFIMWLFFFAGSFTVYQNIAVVLAAILVFFAIMGASWASWGIRYGTKYGKKTPRRK